MLMLWRWRWTEETQAIKVNKKKNTLRLWRWIRKEETHSSVGHTSTVFIIRWGCYNETLWGWWLQGKEESPLDEWGFVRMVVARKGRVTAWRMSLCKDGCCTERKSHRVSKVTNENVFWTLDTLGGKKGYTSRLLSKVLYLLKTFDFKICNMSSIQTQATYTSPTRRKEKEGENIIAVNSSGRVERKAGMYVSVSKSNSSPKARRKKLSCYATV